MFDNTAMRTEVSTEVKRAMAIIAALALTAMVFSGVFGSGLASHASVYVAEESTAAGAYMAGYAVVVASVLTGPGAVAGAAIWAA